MAGENRVVITRTPFRISFAGGGTDIPEYYKNYGTGAVVSGAMNRHVFLGVHKYFFENSIRLHYAKVETDVTNINELHHPSARESLRMLGISKGIEISTIADMPSHGTGIGSSSSFAVGLLHALHVWKGEKVTQSQLAEEAIHIEREVLKEAGGRQDQYVAAYGGLLLMEFFKDDTAKARRIEINQKDFRELERHLLFMYTGKERSSSAIHAKQASAAPDHMDSYKKMAQLAYDQCEALENGKWQETGRLLHENWMLKKTLAGGISDPYLDRIYDTARKNGAQGGKIMGAGGGGFFLFFAEPEKHQQIIDSVPELKHEPVGIDPEGSKVIYSQGNPASL
jgi:D-glycero-alpha-D-manno-heptose-7-phosphate kinase